MLTDNQRLKNKEKYLELLSRLNVDLTDFADFLDKAQFFEAPATTNYYGSYAGGACEYALKLCKELGRLCNTYFPGKYSEEDIIKVGLLKNLYKAILFEPYQRNVKNETTGVWEKVMAYRSRDNRPAFGDIGFSSYMVSKNYFSFTDEQVEAICFSNDINKEYAFDIYKVITQYPLAALTHMAELAANYFELPKDDLIEESGDGKNKNKFEKKDR